MPSGLSSLSGASARTLQHFFGTDHLAFGTTNAIGITRNYTSFSQAEQEVINARVWSGIHFRLADEQGAAIGEQVARWQQERFLQPVEGDNHDNNGDDQDGRRPERTTSSPSPVQPDLCLALDLRRRVDESE